MALHILGDYRIDEYARRLLRSDGTEVELPGRAFDVLLTLLRHRGRVVGRSELLDAVWYDSDVTDAALSQALSLARRALGADGHRLIRTLPGHGYCIDLPTEAEPRPAPEADAGASDRPATSAGNSAADGDSRASEPAAAGSGPEPAGHRDRIAPPRRWPRLAVGLALALLLIATLGWFAMPRRGAVPEPLPPEVAAEMDAEPAAAAGHRTVQPPLHIALRLAPGMSAEDAWTLGALRGVLRTGLYGNPDLRVEDATDAGADRGGPRLLGTLYLGGAEAVPREVSVDWLLTAVDGGTRRWRDRAPADRLFEIADRVQARLREIDPQLALIGAGQLSGPVPQAAQQRFARGAEAQSRLRHADAVAEFEAALQAHPGFLLARIELAAVLIEQGYRAAAAAHLREVERALADAADTDAMALRARSLALARDYGAAAEVYRTLAVAHPNVLHWRLAGAETYALTGRGPPALALLAPIAPQTLSPRLRFDYHKIESLARLAAGDADLALEAARRGVEEARRVGEAELEAEAYQNLVGLHYRRGEIAQALRVSDLAVAAGDRGRSLRWRYEARQFRVALLVLDDRPVAQAELDALVSVARTTGDLYREGAVGFILANERYRRLDLEGAIGHRRRALTVLERSGDRYGVDTALQTLFALERLRGERETALVLLQRLQAGRADSPLDRWQLEFESARGEIWLGRPAAAATRLRGALDALGADAQPIGRASLHCLLGQADMLAGEAAAALKALEACIAALPAPAAPRSPTGAAAAAAKTGGVEYAVLRARAEAWRAIAAGRQGRREAVARHLREAEALLRPTRDYRTMEALGELALAAGLVGEPAQAQPLLAWIAQRREATAAALPRALLRRGQCALSRRQGTGDAPQCVEAEAATLRIEHPMLRLEPGPR